MIDEGDFINPYPALQQEFRRQLKLQLRRTGGFITAGEYAACVDPQGRPETAAKLRDRLFTPAPDGTLEWKPEVSSEDLLQRRHAATKAVDLRRLRSLWHRSRRLERRTPYPHLAPVSRTSQLVSVTSYTAAPVLGVDLLVRPPAIFAEDRDGGPARHDLVVGAEALVLVVHGVFDDGALVRDTEYFARLIVGDTFHIPRVVDRVPAVAGACEAAMRPYLLRRQTAQAVQAALTKLNDFGGHIASSFVH